LERAPFAAYQGTDPYVFICYAHDESSVVYPELIWLRDQGFNVWYDEGISPGTVWRDELARAIEDAAAFLFFVSSSSSRSDNCRREVDFAVDRALPVIAVHLEPTQLPRAMRLAIMDRQAIFKHALSRGDYERSIKSALARATGNASAVPLPAAKVPLDPRRGRLFVGVVAVPESGEQSGALTNSIIRYVSWQGGAYRSIRPSDAAGALHAIDYLVEVAVAPVSGTARIEWQTQSYTSGEIVGASRFEESADAFLSKRDRLAEMIGESILRNITDHELRNMAGRESRSLSYGQLLLKAGQLKYLEPGGVAEREHQLMLAIELEPATGLGHALLADLLSWKLMNGVADDADGDTVKLNAEAQRALAFEPNDPQVLLSVGTTYCRMGRYDRGLSLLRRSMTLAPTARARDELARSLCFAGQPDDAIRLFEDILATMPAGHLFPYGRLAVALTQAGRFEEALTFSTEAVVNFPDDYYGWLVHANLLAQLDRFEEARAALAEARRLVPKIRLELVIARTEASYGRNEAQRERLTNGLRRLSSDAG